MKLSAWWLAVIVLGTPAVVRYLPRRNESHCGPSCQARLKGIASAMEQYAMDNKLSDGAVVPYGVLWGKNGYMKHEPRCPTSDFPYIVRRVGSKPRCVEHGLLGSF